MRATRGTDGEAVEHDALVQARAGLGVAHARYWLALNRAHNAEGTTRTAALAQARDELEQATVLGRRIQALQAAQLADTPGSLEQLGDFMGVALERGGPRRHSDPRSP
jgi:hypothetical protein